MGVQIAEILPKKQIKLEDLTGKTIAVDAFNWLYQFLSSIRQPDGTPLQDRQGRITSHLSGLLYRNAKLIENNIMVAYVFDGKPPELKKTLVAKRREIKEEAKAKLAAAIEAGDEEESRKQAARTSELTHDMIEESKLLLSAMGIPVVQAPSEGEAFCAHICKHHDAYSVASQDSDSLIFGSPRMIRNLNITGKRRIRGKEIFIYPEIIELSDVLKELEITHDQLIILSILTGTDYNPGGIKGIGPRKSLKLVKEHGTFEKVFENVKWEFEIEPRLIYDAFGEKEYSKPSLDFQKPDPDKIKKILCDDHDFSEERVNSVIDKLSEKSSQKSLSSFFGK